MSVAITTKLVALTDKVIHLLLRTCTTLDCAAGKAHCNALDKAVDRLDRESAQKEALIEALQADVSENDAEASRLTAAANEYRYYQGVMSNLLPITQEAVIGKDGRILPVEAVIRYSDTPNGPTYPVRILAYDVKHDKPWVVRTEDGHLFTFPHNGKGGFYELLQVAPVHYREGDVVTVDTRGPYVLQLYYGREPSPKTLQVLAVLGTDPGKDHGFTVEALEGFGRKINVLGNIKALVPKE